MKVKIDKDACVGDGTCVEMCPEVFEMEDELAIVKVETIPEELKERVRETARDCPVDAITIEE